MSADGAIPLNIRDALESEIGYVLGVTGQAGTGKSLFVQEIMKSFPDSYMIVTDSENSNGLNSRLKETIPLWKTRHTAVHFWRKIDGIPDSETTLSQQLSYLCSKPNEDITSQILIIDSWTDFLQPINVADRYLIQQSILAATRREGKKTVLVTEIGMTPKEELGLNHSSDSIVTLQKKRIENRMYRELIIEKMRSFPLIQDTYLFTLSQGRFTYIPWYIHQYPAITIERDPLMDPAEKRVSTGNKSLDELTGGGFQRGGLNLVEVDNLAAPFLETIYIPFISNHLLLGRPAIILLPEGWSHERFIDSLSHFVDKSIVTNQIVFFGRHALGKDTMVRSIDDDPWKTIQEIRYESDKLERDFKCEITELFAIDTLENKYGPSIVKGMMAEISAALPPKNRAAVAILSRQQDIKSDSLSPIQHLRVQEINGVLSMYGVNPRTNFLAVRPILSRGYLDYELMPIV